MNAVEVLTGAKALLEKPYAFTKGAMHAKRKTKSGDRVDCYCAVGALRRAAGQDPADLDSDFNIPNEKAYMGGLAALTHVIQPERHFPSTFIVTAYNDNHRKADVLAVIDQAIIYAARESA